MEKLNENRVLYYRIRLIYYVIIPQAHTLFNVSEHRTHNCIPNRHLTINCFRCSRLLLVLWLLYFIFALLLYKYSQRFFFVLYFVFIQ